MFTIVSKPQLTAIVDVVSQIQLTQVIFEFIFLELIGSYYIGK